MTEPPLKSVLPSDFRLRTISLRRPQLPKHSLLYPPSRRMPLSSNRIALPTNSTPSTNRVLLSTSRVPVRQPLEPLSQRQTPCTLEAPWRDPQLIQLNQVADELKKMLDRLPICAKPSKKKKQQHGASPPSSGYTSASSIMSTYVGEYSRRTRRIPAMGNMQKLYTDWQARSNEILGRLQKRS